MRFAALVVVIASAACSSGAASSPAPGDGGADSAAPADRGTQPAAGITGKSCADLARLAECGDNVPMLDIAQTGAEVTGMLCKKDGFPLTGTVSTTTLTFSYTSGSSRGDASLTIAGDTMSGEAVVSGMRYPVTFSRMP